MLRIKYFRTMWKFWQPVMSKVYAPLWPSPNPWKLFYDVFTPVTSLPILKDRLLSSYSKYRPELFTLCWIVTGNVKETVWQWRHSWQLSRTIFGRKFFKKKLILKTRWVWEKQKHINKNVPSLPSVPSVPSVGKARPKSENKVGSGMK